MINGKGIFGICCGPGNLYVPVMMNGQSTFAIFYDLGGYYAVMVIVSY